MFLHYSTFSQKRHFYSSKIYATRRFTDNNTPFAVRKSLKKFVDSTLENKSNKAVKWSKSNGTFVNPGKFQVMKIRSSKNIDIFSLKIGNSEINSTDVVHSLGM